MPFSLLPSLSLSLLPQPHFQIIFPLSIHPFFSEGQGQYYGYGGANGGGGGGGNDLLDLMDDEPAAVSIPAARSGTSGTFSR